MNWKRVVSLLLVLVMVGSAMGPALAASTERKVPARNSPGGAKVAVIM